MLTPSTAISPPVPAGPLFNMNSTKISLKHDEQSRGHVIVLNCSTVGIPKPKITWLKVNIVGAE